MPLPALLAMGGSLAGGLLDMYGAQSASDAYEDMMRQSMDWAAGNRNMGLNLTAPYRQASMSTVGGLMDLLGMPRSSHQLYGDEGWAQTGPLGGNFFGVGTGGNPWYRLEEGAELDWRDPENAIQLYRVRPDGSSVQLTANDYQYNQAHNHPTLAPRMPTGGDLQTDPGYNFRSDEALRMLENSAAARGGVLSGGFARDVTELGQDMASQEYMNIYNRLGSLAGLTTSAGDVRGLLQAAMGAPMGNIGLGGAGMAGNNPWGAWGNALNEIGMAGGYGLLDDLFGGAREGSSYEGGYYGRNPWDDFQIPGMESGL